MKTLSSTKAILCHREPGERKERTGDDGKGKEKKRPLFPSSTARSLFFLIIAYKFLSEYTAGAFAERRNMKMRSSVGIGGFQAISGDTNNNGEMNKCWWTQSELMSDLLFTVHQQGGDDVT